MNCLLVGPVSKDEYGKNTLPLGMTYISSAMKRIPGLNVICVNLNINKILRDGRTPENLEELCHFRDEECAAEVMSLLESEKIDAVFSGGAITNYESIRLIFETAKKYNPSIITVTGGPVLTGEPVIAMRAIEFADYGIIGEGERTIVQLCQTFLNKGDVSKVRGMVINVNGSYLMTPPQEPIKDWTSEIFWPDNESFGFSTILKSELPPRCVWGKTACIRLSRGCPFGCTFCCHTIDKGYRERPLDDFFNELEDQILKYNKQEFFMPESVLAATDARFIEFCARMKEFNLKWSTQIKLTQVTQKMIDTLLDSGCTSVVVGLESASDKILKSMKKNLTIKQIEHGMKLLEEGGLATTGNFIFGDKEETMETVQETLNWWEDHPQYSINLNGIILFPGTELYRYALSLGKIDPLEHFLKEMPFVNISKMSDEEYAEMIDLISLKKKERLNNEELTSYRLENMECTFDIKKMEKRLRGICRQCGKVVDQTIDFMYELAECDYCHRPINMTPPDYLLEPDKIKQGLVFLLQKYGSIGFWGIGGFFKRHISTDMSDLPGVYLFDKNSGGQYGEKKIESVDKVEEYGLEHIVISTTPRFLVAIEIERALKKYPCVKEVSNIYQLLEIEALLAERSGN
ncbi:hypothetical protein C4J81_18585 (plasmid) [Deltaproteobacteria bacterium Smac51]|nr:hypothetical protein C4J81_18585 [Deltaproteobacteria bacterium Smac51]